MGTMFWTARPQHYLYAIVDGLPTSWRPPAAGVGAGAVTARPVTDLTLVASSVVAPPGRSRGAHARHQDVVGSLLDAASVLPFPFATVVSDQDLPHWLAARMDRVRVGLADVRGCVEMTVRLLRLGNDRGSRATGPAGVLRAVADSLVERAGLPNWRYCPTGSGSNAAASLAFLVPRADIAFFLARIAPVAARAHGVAVVPTGPWPPYSFAPELEPELVATASCVSA